MSRENLEQRSESNPELSLLGWYAIPYHIIKIMAGFFVYSFQELVGSIHEYFKRELDSCREVLKSMV